MERKTLVLVVLVVALAATASVLGVLLLRAADAPAHDVSSIPDDTVFSDAQLLAHAQAALDRFRDRATELTDELDRLSAESPRPLSEAETAALWQAIDELVVLRYAVVGTGAELEERLARSQGSGLTAVGLRPDGGVGPLPVAAVLVASDYNVNNDLTSGIIDTYSKFAEDFDTSVNKMITDAGGSGSGSGSGSGGSASGGSAGSGSSVSTAQLTTDGLVVQAKQSLRDTVGGSASAAYQTLKKLAQKLDQ